MNELIKNKINTHPIIPIYYHDDINECIAVFNKSYEAGIRVFEFVHRGKNSITNFEKLMEHRNLHAKDMSLGIGTIKTVEDAENFIQLGADFLVSPIVNADLAATIKKSNKVWIPGAMTPTEIALCEELGAKIIKIFPASTVGINYISSIKPLFPELDFIVTGGISTNPDEIKNWFNQKVLGIGLGSALFKDLNDEVLFKSSIQQLLHHSRG